DSIDEIGKMTGTAAELLELFIFFIKSNSAVVTRDDQRAAFTVSDDANARAVIFVHVTGAMRRRKPAHFIDQRGRFIIVKNNQRVRRRAIINVTQAAANAQDAR